jgi:hypothetical protein
VTAPGGSLVTLAKGCASVEKEATLYCTGFLLDICAFFAFHVFFVLTGMSLFV